MSERQLWDDYEIRGKPYEIWTDGGPDHWYIACPRCRTVITPDDKTHFNPELSHKEVQGIADSVYDWFVD